MRWLSICLAAAACLLQPAVHAAEEVDERTAAYREYRAAFDAGSFAAAVPLAVRVVELTRSRFGGEAAEMINPLNNLGTTHLRLGQYEPALDAYRAALEVAELLGDPTSARLVQPLHGLGLALRGLERHGEAVQPLKRAVDITRNRDGLRSPTQLPLLHALIGAYVATGLNEDAAREQQNSYGIAVAQYGKGDARLLPELASQAAWYEDSGRYRMARLMHEEAARLADAVDPSGIRAVSALRGISRSYRLASVHGELADPLAPPGGVSDPFGSGGYVQVMPSVYDDGERVLRTALARLSAVAGTEALRGRVLIDLGDWYLMGGPNARSRALLAYREAWKELAVAGETALLEKPVAVTYRPPSIAVSRRMQDPDMHLVQEVQLRVAISAEGGVRDVVVANAAPERESAERALMVAVRRTVWRPAMQDGRQVATNDFLFSERVYVRPGENAAE